VHEQREIAAVVEDQVGALAALERGELELDVVPVLFEVLALPREHRDADLRDRRGRLVLRRVDVARSPRHLGAERDQRLDQHRGLDRHVETAGDARALERRLRLVLLADRHQAGHLLLGHADLLAAELGQSDVLDS